MDSCTWLFSPNRILLSELYVLPIRNELPEFT